MIWAFMAGALVFGAGILTGVMIVHASLDKVLTPREED